MVSNKHMKYIWMAMNNTVLTKLCILNHICSE
jgi:hypothetical protein